MNTSSSSERSGQAERAWSIRCPMAWSRLFAEMPSARVRSRSRAMNRSARVVGIDF